MRLLTILFFLLPGLPIQAEIYKCTVNGNTEFSDQPCSDNAETVTVDVRKPDQQAIENQQEITATFEEESRVHEIHALNQRNDALEAEILRLQQEREAELEALRARTYDYGDGSIATKEHGLFEKMDQVDADYQQKIEQVQRKIRQNQNRLQTLYQQAPASEPEPEP